jgi:hypothetical protein
MVPVVAATAAGMGRAVGRVTGEGAGCGAAGAGGSGVSCAAAGDFSDMQPAPDTLLKSSINNTRTQTPVFMDVIMADEVVNVRIRLNGPGGQVQTFRARLPCRSLALFSRGLPACGPPVRADPAHASL